MMTLGVEGRSLRPLFVCVGPPNNVRGFELRDSTVDRLDGISTTLIWLKRNLPKEATFVVIDAPAAMIATHVDELFQAADPDLVDKIVVAIPLEQDNGLLIGALNRHGFKIALDRVGPNARFSDLGRHVVHAIRLEADFLHECEGDPAQASALDGIVRVARNLGLPTIATGVSEDLATNFLTSVGIDYASVR